MVQILVACSWQYLAKILIATTQSLHPRNLQELVLFLHSSTQMAFFLTGWPGDVTLLESYLGSRCVRNNTIGAEQNAGRLHFVQGIASQSWTKYSFDVDQM